MGRIYDAVYDHWGPNREHERLLNAFLNDFDVTWADHFTKYSRDVFAYFLKPHPRTAEAIGIESEIAAIVSPFPKLPAAALQAAEAYLNKPPAAGRVEPLAYGFVAPVADLNDQVRAYLSNNHQSRLIVPFSFEELTAPRDWFVRQRFASSLTARDLFDMQQPLARDTYYFGRTNLVTDLLDRFKSGENSGLFGLRKTGKTSAVFRLIRLIDANQLGTAIYVDAQGQGVYSLRWWELLGEIAKRLMDKARAKIPQSAVPPYSESSAANSFQTLLTAYLNQLSARRRRILLVVDEIEHIAPNLGPNGARHWESDFLPLWKTLRAIQTSEPRLTFLIVGVNAWAVEKARLQRQENPLFSLVGIRYIPSFSQTEVREMIRTMGRPMGIKFENDAVKYLTERYGGHPSLTRLACSWHHKRASETEEIRPLTLTRTILEQTSEQRELELIPHVDHILGVLKDWYKDEFDLLTSLAQGDQSGFQEFAQAAPAWRHHLDQYGLISWDDAGIPHLRVAVVGKFLRTDAGTRGELGQLGGPESWLDLVMNITRLRNALEPRLRRFVKQILRSRLGPERWIDPIVKTMPSEEQLKLTGVDREEILSERIYLSNLIAVIQGNWEIFRVLESSHKNRMDKSQIVTLLKYVNAHREDAHAKDVSEAEVATLAVVCKTLSNALEEHLTG